MKFLRILSWAVFLGMSWTWCIGMFLPVLLIRDYGPWAWLVFAIPNVVGAAAMAWVLPDAQASQHLVQNHKTICELFSVITLAFHAFFIPWIFRYLIQELDFPLPWTMALLIIPIVSFFTQRSAAIITLAVSVIAATLFWHAEPYPYFNRQMPITINVIWIALVCTFGLSQCPYLDLTFHKARQATSPAAGKAAFAIGFGVVFFSMLLFTLAYSKWLLQRDLAFTNLIATALGMHLLGQSILKLCLHTQALARLRVLALVSCVIAFASGFVAVGTHFFYHGLSLFELLYRLFMSFYGLIFPAYVWICIFGKNRPTIFAAAVLIAAPFYWMGFIERQMIYLFPGVALVFCARFLPHGPAEVRRITQ